MIDRTQEIKRFLEKHYKPCESENKETSLQKTTGELLYFLFSVFPTNCIDTYDLFEILTQLGHEPQKIGPTEFVWILVEK